MCLNGIAREVPMQTEYRSHTDGAPVNENGEHWASALCHQFPDPDSLWFPNQGESERITKALCQMCPERVPCLDYAMTHEPERGVRFGIWGGLGPTQRARLAAERRRAAAS